MLPAPISFHPFRWIRCNFPLRFRIGNITQKSSLRMTLQQSEPFFLHLWLLTCSWWFRFYALILRVVMATMALTCSLHSWKNVHVHAKWRCSKTGCLREYTVCIPVTHLTHLENSHHKSHFCMDINPGTFCKKAKTTGPKLPWKQKAAFVGIHLEHVAVVSPPPPPPSPYRLVQGDDPWEQQ